MNLPLKYARRSYCPPGIEMRPSGALSGGVEVTMVLAILACCSGGGTLDAEAGLDMAETIGPTLQLVAHRAMIGGRNPFVKSKTLDLSVSTCKR